MRLAFLVFASFLGLIACDSPTPSKGGTGGGNPESVQLMLVGLDTFPRQTNLLASSSQIQIEEAYINFEKIRFVRGSACQDEGDTTESQWQGPYLTDLIDGSSQPEIESTDLETDTTYCRIDLQIKKVSRSDVTPESIIGNSIYVRGTTRLGKDFEVRFPMSTFFRLRAEAAFSVSSSDSFILGFDLTSWFDGIDLDSAEETDGVIVVGTHSNRSLRNQIRRNIQSSSLLLRDVNKNGELDFDEFQSANILAQGEEE